MNVLREGWHPKGKDGGRESWRGDYKGVNQVAGWVGKGKNPNARNDAATNHVSRPLASLKDPSAFGPPPKNVNFHGGAALPNETTPDRSGLGAPLSTAEVAAAESAVQPQPDIGHEAQIASPPLPYRANRTGLRTDNLLPPPIRRFTDNTDEARQGESPVQAAAKPKPSLPPRLPPRSNSLNVVADEPSPPPAYTEQPKSAADSYLNQDAIGRLGKAGVKIPGFGIGQSQRSTNPDQTQSTSTQSSPIGLQGHLSRMTSKQNSASPSPNILPPPNASQGTTLAQKQAALRTAQSFHKDPSSVSLSDAQTAAQTANNFRERHHEQITVGAQKANTWNKKHNFTNRVNSFLEQQSTQPQQGQQSPQPPAELPAPQDPAPQVQTPVAPAPGLHVRKAPPPPPPKKPNGMHGQTTGGPGPPPIPLGTKPSFG